MERDELCEKIIDMINDAVSSHEEHVENDGMAEIPFYMWENVKKISDLDHLGGETKVIVKAALAMGHSEEKIIEVLKNNSSIELGGIYVPDKNYLNSWCLGEQEIQVEGLENLLSELTDEELEEITENCDAYLGDKPTDLIYVNMSDSVYYLMPDLDKICLELGIEEAA